MSLDSLVVKDFDKIFSNGQGYVALSRAKTLDGLIISDYTPDKIMVDESVIEFYKTIESSVVYKYTPPALMNKDIILNLIKKAINENKPITIEYNDGTKTTVRKIHPADIYTGKELKEKQPNKNYKDKTLYVRAFCTLRGENRDFNLERIQNADFED